MSTEEERTIEMWTRGDYGLVGDWFASASVGCLDGLPLQGKRVLDVACGTGAVAIEAARRGATVTGIDLTPAMLAEAARRATNTGVEIEWKQGSFIDLSDNEPADIVTSAFGVMFAKEPGEVLKQLSQVCRPGGVISIAAWAPGGAFGGPPPEMIEEVPILGKGPKVTKWGTFEGLSSILQEAALAPEALSLKEVNKHTIELPFVSTAECIDLMIEHSGPWGMLFDYMEEQGLRTKARSLLLDHLTSFSVPTNQGIQLQVTYSIARFQANTPTDTQKT